MKPKNNEYSRGGESLSFIRLLPGCAWVWRACALGIATLGAGIIPLQAQPGGADPAFHPAGQVGTFALQPDGKIIAGGLFGTGTAFKGLARLNWDGSLDNTFGNAGPDSGNGIGYIVPLADGKTLVGGEFGQFDGQTLIRLARLESNGALDVGWTAGSVLERSTIGALAVQPDGSILVGVSSSGGVSASVGLLRLHANGVRDTNFLADGVVDGAVYAIQVLTNGDFYIGGRFTMVGSIPRAGIARLKADGSVDTAFDPGAGVNGEVTSLLVQSDGRVLVAGEFTNVAGLDRLGLARLTADGSGDTSFDAGKAGGIKSLAVQADGKIVIAGVFYYIQGVRHVGLARLLPDGKLDWDFASGEGNYRQVAIQPDGLILVGGSSSPGLFRFLSEPGDFPGRFEIFPEVVKATEGAGPAALTVKRSGGSKGQASVSYGASLFSQIIASGTITFDDGETEKTISIPIPDDQLVHVGAAISVILVSASVGAQIGYYHWSEIDVQENDTGFAIGAASCYENDGVVVAVVTRAGADFSPMQVEYATVDGSAKAGLDYVAQSGTLHFDEGETSQAIAIALLDNPAVQWMHTFSIVLKNPSNGVLLINGGAGQVALMDVASQIAFDGYGNYTTNEAAGMALISVRRGVRTSNQVSVHYQTEGGTAIPGVDYQPTSGTLTFAAGETVQTFAVPLLDNVVPQTNRTVQLRLSNPSAEAVLDVPPDASLRTLVIMDDDHPGDLDLSFNPSLGPGAWVTRLALTPSQKIIASGSSLGLIRLGLDGASDQSFRTFAWAAPTCLLLANDNRLWTGGWSDWLRTLAPDGTLAWSSPNVSGISVLALQPDQKVLVGVSSWSGLGLARLLPNGDYDPSFVATGAREMSVAAIAVQPEGQILCGGSSPGSSSGPCLVRLNGDGTLDGQFTGQLATFESTNGMGGPVITALLLQPDGGVLVGGRFDRVGGRATRNLVRLKANGAVDETWAVGSGFDGVIQQLALQGDGGILVIGSFQNVQGVPRPSLARLQPDGKLDTSFSPDIRDVSALLVQSDGHIVVGGGFYGVNGQIRPGLARLRGNPEAAAGVVSFVAGPSNILETAGTVDLRVQRTGGTRGRIVVPYAVSGGTAIAGTDIVPASGSIEFADGEGLPKTITLQVQADGQASGDKSVELSLGQPIGGAVLGELCTVRWTIQDVDCVIEFATTEYRARESDPTVTVKVARRGNLRGEVAAGYSTRAGSAKPGVDYVFTAGVLRFVEGQTEADLVLQLIDDAWGQPDSDFWVDLTTPSPDCRLGTNKTTRIAIADDDRPGTARVFFSTNLPAWVTPPRFDQERFAEVSDLALDSSRRILALYRCIRYPISSSQAGLSSVTRFAPEGTLDFSFWPGGGPGDSTLPDDDVTALAWRRDSSVLVGTPTRLVRVLPTGQAEPGAFGGVVGYVQALSVFPEGSFLAGGALRFDQSETWCHLVRRKADGSADPLFRTVVATGLNDDPRNAFVSAVAVDAEGRVLVGGGFSSIQGVGYGALARLASNGEIDRSFHGLTIYGPTPGEGRGPGAVRRIVVQPDGRILIAGRIDEVNGVKRPNLARLLPDGTLDTAFVPALPFGWMHADLEAGIEDLAVQKDGKIVVVGRRVVDGQPGWDVQTEGRIARLNPDGSLDSLFDANGAVATLAAEFPVATIHRVLVDPDGSLLIGGLFNCVNGVRCPGLARINGGVALGFTRISRNASGRLVLEANTPLPAALQLQASTDLVSWTTIATNTVPAGALQWETPVPPGLAAQFFRLRAKP
jgi:uncharacterized delta-60 repeat protein